MQKISCTVLKMARKNIEEVFKELSKITGSKVYRHIQVDIINGKKIPKDEDNSMSLEQIKNNGGNNFYNTLSLYVKHIPSLYVFDFDTKDLKNCKLKEFLDDDNVLRTETKKGYHYYVFINNMVKYSNQLKVLKENYDLDLIKKNNIWETKDRKSYGELKRYEWNELKNFINLDKLNILNSKDGKDKSFLSNMSPPNSEEQDLTPSKKELNPVTKFELEKVQKAVKSLNIERANNYKQWLDLGLALYNGGNNNDKTFQIWLDFSKKSDKFDANEIIAKWLSFSKNYNNKTLTFKSIYFWLREDNPEEYKNICNVKENRFSIFYTEGINKFMEMMNKECMYYTETGNILYLNDERLLNNKVHLARNFYSKYSFKVEKKSINPFDIWISNGARKDIDKIIFEPNKEPKENEINLWNGYKYKNTGTYDEENLKPFLNHIKEILGNGDEDNYNYILNWFARIIQNPGKKNAICLILNSKEGVGKSIVLDLIGEIIGNEYYASVSSLENILGRFNSLAEKKILINLNETNWGGDKKMKGKFKSFITDNTIIIEQKGKSPYVINNLSNCIITTNEDWIVDIKKDDRRFNILKCSDKLYDSDYYKKIINTNVQDLTNFLYNRDISSYNPKDFKKSELHNEQVITNYNTVEQFLYCVKEGDINIGLNYENENEDIIINKGHIYELYRNNTHGTHSKLFNIVGFWKEFRKLVPKCKFIKSNNHGGPRIKISLNMI